MARVQSNYNNSSDNCHQTFTDTSSASTIPGTSMLPPAIAPTSQLTFDALESTTGQHLYEDQQPLMVLSSASIGATNEGTMPNNTIGSLIAPPQLPAVGLDLALQNEIFLHNTQMEAVRQKYVLRPKGTSQAYDPIQRRFTAILNAYSTNAHERNSQQYADRGAGSIFDGYNSEDVYSDRVQGLLDLLLGYYLLLRGNNRREIKLADLYLLPLENEGPTKCKVLVILLCNGKTNQHGQVDHAGAMRNQEVLVSY
ncbi:hypothetical protein V1527DRAFT_481567 [Lipomyces starkeyi]